jgi:hypothetical protein
MPPCCFCRFLHLDAPHQANWPATACRHWLEADGGGGGAVLVMRQSSAAGDSVMFLRRTSTFGATL